MTISDRRQALYSKARNTQNLIRRGLANSYGKAFDPRFQPGFFDDSARFHQIKKPIARQLRYFCRQEVNFASLPEIAYFISEYEASVKLNSDNDPVGYLDGVRGKKEHGELGGLLSKFSRDVMALKDELNEYMHNSKNENALRYAFYSHLASMTRQISKLDGLSFKGDVPLTSFHILAIQKIYKICQDSGMQSLAEEILPYMKSQLDTSTFIVSDIALELNQQAIESKMFEFNLQVLECRKKALALDMVNRINDGAYQQIPAEHRIKHFLIRNILFHFIDSLLYLEKDYFWNCHTIAASASLNNLIVQGSEKKKFSADGKISFLDHHTLSANGIKCSGTNVIDETLRYYMNAESLDYKENDGLTDLLNNKALIELLLSITDSNDLVSIKPNEIKARVEKHIQDGLDEFKILKDSDSRHGRSNLWKTTMMSYPNADWTVYLVDMLNTMVLTPIADIDELMSKLEADPAYISEKQEEQCLVDLIRHAREMVNGVDNLINMKVVAVNDLQLSIAEDHAAASSIN